MSDSFMRLRCKAGDLAFIINDEIGCEPNIGRIVKVVGDLDVDEFGLPEWLIKPLHAETWLVKTKRGVELDTSPFKLRIGHPDTWLMPLTYDTETETETEVEDRSEKREVELNNATKCEC